MKYKYYIVYSFKSENIFSGTGALDILTKYKLNTSENIEHVREFIQNKNNFEMVIITNIIRLKK